MPDIEKSLQQLLVTNFGLSPSGYAGSRGDTGYVGSGGLGYTGSVGPAGAGASGPRITSIGYPGDDTAANILGGDTITLTGANFAAGAMVIINGNAASVVSVVNSTTITFTAPPNPTGSYLLYVVNQDGATTLAVPGLQYSGTPAWSTAAGTLGSGGAGLSFNTNVAAIGDAPITYSVYSGELPTGLTLTANTGVISGTSPTVSVDTTYTFTLRATDAQRQDTDRSFNITIQPALVAEYLVVAGGGGGGGAGTGRGASGGGGAGGMLTGNVTLPTGTSIGITIGAAGSGGAAIYPTAPYEYRGNNGGNSSIGVSPTITAVGGGGGGILTGGATGDFGGKNGGSGGGGGWVGQSPAGNGIPGQGNNGGITSQYYGGGGGGAGSAGGGAGGKGGGGGASSSISGSSVTYAGGGGGGGSPTDYGAQQGPGFGQSGGGNGGLSAGSAADANTGSGGGGGGGNLNTNGPGGNGGSGIVIVRYADTKPAATNTTGSPTVTVAGGYRIYKWTSSGSITI